MLSKSNQATVERNSLQWLPSIFQSFSYTGFLLIWLGQISRTLVMGMEAVARPVLVLALTGSAVQLGLVSIVRATPMFLVAPIAGLIVDRYDRRSVMISSKIVHIVLHVIFAILILTGRLELWHIYATAMLKSMIQGFDGPARQALLPNLVPQKLLVNALALNSGSNQVAKILSTSMGGFLIAIWAALFGFGSDDVRAFGGVYLVIVAGLLISLIVTFLLKVPDSGKIKKSKEPWSQSLLEGFKYAWHSPIILGNLALLTVQSLFGVPYMQVFVPWISLEVMGIGPEGMGILLGLSALGSFIGATIMASMSSRLRKRGMLIIIGLVVYGLALVTFGFSSLLEPVSMFGMFIPVLPALMLILVGLVKTITGTVKNSVLFEYIPNELRGRVMSLQKMDRSLSTLGSGLAGFVIAITGGPLGLALYGSIFVVGTGIVGYFMPSFRKVE